MLPLAWTGLAVAATPCAPPPLVVAERARSETIDRSCLFVDIDAAGRGFARIPDEGLSRGVELSRGRLELGMRAPGDVLTRIAMTETRSGGEDGYVGINGEALVLQLQLFEARWDWRATGLSVAAGLVDQPWTMTVQGPWQRREIAAPLITDRGWMPRSDMGGWLGWSEADGLVSVTAAVLTGEGSNRRERNTGVDVSGTVHVRPLARSDSPIGLELAAYGQEGSRGIAQARDHRLGGAAIVTSDVMVAGVDGLLGWGLGGDGELLPAGVSAWTRTGALLPVVAWAKVDVGTDDSAAPDSLETAWMVGGGPRLPFAEPGPGAIVVGYEGRQVADDASAVAGSPVSSTSHLVFVQIQARLRGILEFGPPRS